MADPSGDALDLARLADTLRLTDRQRLFAENLARGMSLTEAAREAGSASPQVQGCRWGKAEKIQQYKRAFISAATARGASLDKPIDKALSIKVETGVMTSAEILLRLARRARASLAPHLKVDEDGDFEIAIDPEHLDSLQECTEDKIYGGDKGGDGVTVRRKIRVKDDMPALALLAKINGLDLPQQANEPRVVHNYILAVLKSSPEARKALDVLAREVVVPQP